MLAAKTGDSQQTDHSWRSCATPYRPPLYRRYIRRDGHDPAEAQDLTQEFFARLLAQHNVQDNCHHQEGKFRSFLLAYVKNFLLEQRRRGRAQKRGGGCEFISLNQPMGGKTISWSRWMSLRPLRFSIVAGLRGFSKRRWIVCVRSAGPRGEDFLVRYFAELPSLVHRGDAPTRNWVKIWECRKPPSNGPCIKCGSAMASCCGGNCSDYCGTDRKKLMRNYGISELCWPVERQMTEVKFPTFVPFCILTE